MAAEKPETTDDLAGEQSLCKTVIDHTQHYREALPEVVEAIVSSCREDTTITHVDAALIPSKDEVTQLIAQLFDLVYPGFFSRQEMTWASLPYHVGQEVTDLFDRLSLQISRSIRHECRRLDSICSHCLDTGQRQAVDFLCRLPEVRTLVAGDVKAAYRGDPAAQSYDEVVFSYPGLYAITVYRLARVLHQHGVPLLPRMMTEHAHGVTGIDIHPGARIGPEFFIDHGTGVVIGETTEIGKSVTLYQGVTLGALSFQRTEDGDLVRGTKRHPTIEDRVIIYAGATILGGGTIIGADCVIGGNVWITQSVPAGTKVTLSPPKLVYKQASHAKE